MCAGFGRRVGAVGTSLYAGEVAKAAPKFACSECGYTAGRWFGRCPGCGAFGTLLEEAPPAAAKAGPSPRPLLRLVDVEVEEAARIPTGVPEHAVELGDAGRDTGGLLDLDVDEAEQRARRRAGLGSGGGRRLLQQRPERAAAGTAAEPAAGRVAALGARELGGGLRHEASLGSLPDGHRPGRDADAA